MFGWHISHHRCGSWQWPICQAYKKISSTFACCSKYRDIYRQPCQGGEEENGRLNSAYWHIGPEREGGKTNTKKENQCQSDKVQR